MNVIDEYTKQAAEHHALQIDKGFWMMVKKKPKWMPMFLYKAVIKNLVEFQEHRIKFWADDNPCERPCQHSHAVRLVPDKDHGLRVEDSWGGQGYALAPESELSTSQNGSEKV